MLLRGIKKKLTKSKSMKILLKWLIDHLFPSKCNNCKFRNDKFAEEMFYKDYCDLMDCQITKEYYRFCKYQDTNQK